MTLAPPLAMHAIARPLAAGLLLGALWMATIPAQAGEGHDHGEAPAAAAGSALPRFSAGSELFELVGVLNGKQLTLYLDTQPAMRRSRMPSWNWSWAGASSAPRRTAKVNSSSRSPKRLRPALRLSR